MMKKKGESMAGKLVVIEGGDGTGKETQSKMLVERLNQAHVNTGAYTFPDYEGYWGKQIRQYLKGEFGDIAQSGPYFPALLYAQDRNTKKDELTGSMAYGKSIVSDRYLPSNLVYQGVKLDSVEDRDKFNDWLLDVEYGRFNIPKPDLTIILQLSSKAQAKHIKEREEKLRIKDIHEEDGNYRDKVAKEYARLAQKYNWKTVNCSDENGQQLSRQEIADKIWQVVKSTFKIDS